MNFNNYTIKSQEAIQKAIEIASGNQQQSIEPAHLMKALLLSDENVISFIVKKLSVNRLQLDEKLDEIIKSYPKISGQQPYLSNDSNKVLQKATGYLKDFGDEFVAIEHLVIALTDGSDKTASLLKSLGFNKKDLITIIKELRGGDTVSDQNAESKYRSLDRYSNNLNKMALDGKIDPVIGRDDEIRRLLQILSRRTKTIPFCLASLVLVKPPL